MVLRPAVVAGALARKAGNGGHAAFLLAWLRGLRMLGFDPVFCDHIELEALGAPVNGLSNAAPVRWLRRVLGDAGFGDAWTLAVTVNGEERHRLGLDRASLDRRTASALVIDIMGYLRDETLLAASAYAIFVDVDPGFGQMWCALGQHDNYGRHDAYVTVATAINTISCTVPQCTQTWVPTLPPVVLEPWVDPPRPPRNVVTTVASWRGAYHPVEFGGQRYGLRVHEFRRFAQLASSSPWQLEMALAIDPADEPDRRDLVAAGWTLADPDRVAAHPDAYAAYISSSAAELTVAKHMYVATRSGWFSDRSARYLAVGRPVIMQDTGVEGLPTGIGLLLFSTVDEARDALEQVATDWRRHARAARQLAEEHLAADRVIGRLLQRVGAS